MSIVINLLPDLRQVRLKERRQRRLATVVSIMVASTSVGILLLLFVFAVGQQAVIDSLSKNINNKRQTLESKPSLIDALTAQQHIASLPIVWAQRVYLNRLFDAYEQANPTDVSLNGLSISVDNVIEVTGSAGSYQSVAKLAEAMSQENITFGKNAKLTNQPYFRGVNIRSASSSSSGFTFSITASLSSEAVSGN